MSFQNRAEVIKEVLIGFNKLSSRIGQVISVDS